MKCEYMRLRDGCVHGCTSDWIKCHSYFDGRGCEYSEDARCHRGWHYRTSQEYENAKKKPGRQIAISSDDSHEEPPAKRQKEHASSEEPSSSQGPQSLKASTASLEKMRWHTHVANLHMDIKTIDDKTGEDVKKAYESIHDQMVRKKVPVDQLLRITGSFHAVMRRKNCD